MHHRINAEIVRHGSQHDVAQAERVRNEIGNMAVGDVVHHNVFHAALIQAGGKALCRLLGVAVHGSVGDQHTAILGLIAAPKVVLLHEIGEILSPHGTMQRADKFDLIQQAGSLLQQGLHLRAVLAHNIGIVAAGIVDPVAVKVHLVGKEGAVQRAEGAEGVRGEERTVCGVEGNKNLRPVHHRGGEEGEGMLPEAQGRAFLDLDALMVAGGEAELLHHREGLRGGNHLHLRIAQQDFLDGSAVIRLHVVDHQIVERTAREDVIEIFQQLAAGGPVHRIEQDSLFIRQHISVVRDPTRNRVDVFKEVETVIVRANPEEILCNLAYIVHGKQNLLSMFRQAVCLLISETGKVPRLVLKSVIILTYSF